MLEFSRINNHDSHGISAGKLAIFIQSLPGLQGGMPVFQGTRVPVQSLFDHLEAGESMKDFLEGFRTVKRE